LKIFKQTLLIAFFLLSGLRAHAQTDTVCVSNPVGNYHVIGSPLITFVWDAFGNGVITGQGNDTISVLWNGIISNFTLSVVETSIDGCEGLPQILNISVVGSDSTFATLTSCNPLDTDRKSVV
jgi:hypothetical protein